jgi:hypothetical protein
MRSLKSSWVLRGPDAAAGVAALHSAIEHTSHSNHSSSSHSSSHNGHSGSSSSHSNYNSHISSSNHSNGSSKNPHFMSSPTPTDKRAGTGIGGGGTGAGSPQPTHQIAHSDELYHSPHAVNGYQRSISALSNSQAVLPLLERAAHRAGELFKAGAYVHQYQQHGLEEDDFVRAFMTVGQVVENYRAI